MFNFFNKLKGIEIISPMTGEAIDLSQVPDPVFSEKMVGDGIAIIPTENRVVAPCDGKIVQIFPTNHAIGIETTTGLDLLIHIGIDTVDLKGEGFKRLVEEGDTVKMGDPILEIDIKRIQELGKPLTSPVVITNADEVEFKSRATGKVEAGKSIAMNIKKTK
ncbi:MAG: PTS glucose transporter subunit IIA [Niameybacter sp.]|uniref:PTS sugar transporter subunit IIA n=1 Tax=Niameybacter sp. TaxID=2033640 RepID=UPI002FC7D5C1